MKANSDKYLHLVLHATSLSSVIEVVDGKVQLGSIDARRGALSKTDKIHFADHTFCKRLT